MREQQMCKQFVVSQATPEAGLKIGTSIRGTRDSQGHLLLEICPPGTGEIVHIQGTFDRRRRLTKGTWLDDRYFEIELAAQESGGACLHCSIRGDDHEPTSDSWTADEDGP